MYIQEIHEIYLEIKKMALFSIAVNVNSISNIPLRLWLLEIKIK